MDGSPIKKRLQKVQVWVLRHDLDEGWRVLLLRTLPERGGYWQPVTGGAESGESLAAAAHRELLEETGLQVKIQNVLPLGYSFEFESRWGGVASEEVFVTIFNEDESGEKFSVRLDFQEHDCFQWTNLRQAFSFLHHEQTKKCLQMVSDRFTKKNSS